MSNAAWCDLNSKRHNRELQDVRPNPKCKCQKQIEFSPTEYQLEGSGFKYELQKVLEKTRTPWNKSLRPAINAKAPVIGMALAAESKTPAVAQAKTNILKSISGGKVLSSSGMYGNGLGLRVL